MYPQEFDYNDAALKWRTSKPDKKKKTQAGKWKKKKQLKAHNLCLCLLQLEKTTTNKQSMLMFC